MDAFIDLTVANEEEEMADEEYENALKVTTAIIAGVEIAWQSQIEARHQNCLYLRHAQLLPDPHGDTPWQRLYSSQNNRAFITIMGFDVDTFGYSSHLAFLPFGTPQPFHTQIQT